MMIDDRTVIQKPVLLCDSCNNVLVDENGVVQEDCKWTDWGLVCSKHKGFDKGFTVFEEFKKGQKISKKHKLFAPMVIASLH